MQTRRELRPNTELLVWSGKLLLFGMLLTSLLVQAHASTTIANDRWMVTIEPGTLAVTVQPKGCAGFLLSAPQPDLGPARDLKTTDVHAQWHIADTSVSMGLKGNDLRVSITSAKAGDFTWPVMSESKPWKALIWPRWEGCYVPLDDAKWTEYLIGEGEWNTLEGITMPFWGLDCDDYSLTCIVTNPCNNRIVFSRPCGRLQVLFTHEFTPNNDVKEYGFVIRLAGSSSPVEPARQFRKWLIENGRFVSMSEKLRNVPMSERLLGAPHVYLWGSGFFTRYDVHPQKWKSWCHTLVEQSKSDQPTVGKRIKTLMDSGHWAQVAEISTLDYPYAFVESEVAAEVSRLLERPDFYDKAAWAGIRVPAEASALLGREHRSTAETCRMNGLLLQTAYPDALLPVDDWGDGVSRKMISEFRKDGFDRMMMICVGGVSDIEKRPEIVTFASRMGYLFGAYDSYHSIHDPALRGSDATWETAQFDQKLYDTGAIIGRNGTKLRGFKQIGYKLSPVAAWPYVQKRVGENMSLAPFNYYFLDCDAFGEAYDDYSPMHPATQAKDIAARVKRLAWISDAYHAVVGSEGGSSYAAPAIHVAEGMFGPPFGWGDTDLTDKKSPYYLGAYYPPDGPKIFTQQVPLKPEYEYLFYNPRFRLPLYETVFHDSVVSTTHWSCGSLKFKNVLDTVELTELLYQIPPLYHINQDEYLKHRDAMLTHFKFFSPIHRELGFAQMTDFAWLTPDRLVQRTSFGDKAELVANFRQQPYAYRGASIPARSIMLRWLQTGKTQTFTP